MLLLTSPAMARGGMIATSQPLASAAGLQVLREGGNAILVSDLPGGNMVASPDVFQGGAGDSSTSNRAEIPSDAM